MDADLRSIAAARRAAERAFDAWLAFRATPTETIDAMVESMALAIEPEAERLARLVALRKTGSATVAPAHAAVEVLDHLRGARAGAVPVSVRLDGEYGVEGVVLGVPCRLGPRGLIEIEEIPLAEAERTALARAAAAVRSRIDGTDRQVGAP